MKLRLQKKSRKTQSHAAKRGKNENEMTKISHVSHDYYSIPPLRRLYSHIKLHFNYIFVTLLTNSITSSVVAF